MHAHREEVEDEWIAIGGCGEAGSEGVGKAHGRMACRAAVVAKLEKSFTGISVIECL